MRRGAYRGDKLRRHTRRQLRFGDGHTRPALRGQLFVSSAVPGLCTLMLCAPMLCPLIVCPLIVCPLIVCPPIFFPLIWCPPILCPLQDGAVLHTGDYKYADSVVKRVLDVRHRSAENFRIFIDTTLYSESWRATGRVLKVPTQVNPKVSHRTKAHQANRFSRGVSFTKNREEV